MSFRVIISSKEKSSSIDFYKKHFEDNMIEFEVGNVSDGDLAFYDFQNDKVLGIFEIKSFSDLYSTIRSGRMMNQFEKLINHGRRYIFVFGSISDLEKVMLFDESGKYNPEYAKYVVKEFYNMATWDFFINMKFFETKIDMVLCIIDLFNRLGVDTPITRFDPEYISKSEPIQIQILSKIPGIQSVLAYKLMVKFGNIVEIGSQTAESLRSINRIGKQKAENIITCLRGELDEMSQM